MNVAYNYGQGLTWESEYSWNFVSNLKMNNSGYGANHISPYFVTCYPSTVTEQLRPSTPAILMTKAVYDKYRKARPNAEPVKFGWLQEIDIEVPEYKGEVFGGDFVFKAFLS